MHAGMLQPGTRLGSWEIVSPIGDTGEAWRARDPNLNRDVEIRALPPASGPDADRLNQHLGLLTALEHPHIARVYGLEESGGARFLVSELIEGESLADRLKRGAIPLAESLKLALEIAEALEAAHEKGVVHRDLNPGNIRVTPGGEVRILDLGLSGLLGADEAAADGTPDFSHSPTLSVTATRSGAFSGTAGYMSPEQARGEAADIRSDVWAFGCVLFEMLAGQAAFGGRTESDARAAVLRSAPGWDRLPPDLHPRVRFLLERCLQKEIADRAEDMAGVRADIEKTLEDPAGVSAIPGAARAGSVLPWVAAVALAGILGVAASWALRPDAPSPVVRFQMWASQPGGVQQALQAVSPELGISDDGDRIVFRGLSGGLYVRDRADMTSRPVQITGETDSLYAPFFSPDGRELFFVETAVALTGPATVLAPVFPRQLQLGQIPEPGLDLKKVPVDGGAPTPVLTGRRDEVLDPIWSTGDTILFVDSRGTIQSVSANGGTPATLLEAPGARHPQLLPGGEWVLYSIGDLVTPIASGAPVPTGEIVVQSLVDPEDRRVIWEGGTQARYVAATGHIVYAGTTRPGLWAFAFDAGRLEKTGDPVPMVAGLIVDYALSGAGSLAYAAVVGFDLTTGDSPASDSILALVSRAGGAITRRLRVDPGRYRNPRVSPDGNRVAYEFADASGESHIWVYDLVEDFPRKLTSEGENTYPVWKDDDTLTWASERDGAWGIYSQRADGGAEAELVVAAPDGSVYRPQAWSPDGTLVLVAAAGGEGARAGRLAMLSPGAGDGEVSGIAPAQPGSDEFGAVLSPDGAWLAYIAECGAFLGCARVQRFPPVPGSSFQVSENEAWVQFSPDGAQLLTSRINFFDVRDVSSTGGTIDFVNPRRVPFDGFQAMTEDRSLDLRGPDGQEFVMVVPANAGVADPAAEGGNDIAAVSSRIDFFHNFFEVLENRVQPSAAR